MRTSITYDDIIHIYQFCGISTRDYGVPKSTINTGNLNGYLNYNFHNMLSSDSADRLRWA